MKYLSLASSLWLIVDFHQSWGYVPAIAQKRWSEEGYDLNKALKIIEEGAETRPENDDELYYAVRYIDRNAHTLYSDDDVKHELWEKAKGSWELRMAYEDSKASTFYPYPDFRDFAIAYIIIEDEYFGKGIAKNPLFSFVAMGGPSKIQERTRQLYMNYLDFYLSGNIMPDWDLSYFMQGYARNWYAKERKRPPLAFTLIGVTDKVLVMRGSKTGGMAIFKRIRQDMREPTYGSIDHTS